MSHLGPDVVVLEALAVGPIESDVYGALLPAPVPALVGTKPGPAVLLF